MYDRLCTCIGPGVSLLGCILRELGWSYVPATVLA